jgi:uncharacterized membrane protein YphA (DoxX/SURF4 family)
MKLAVNTARVLVGALYIFSGLVKAIDPLGLAYKMQEFFEKWAESGFLKGLMHWLDQYAKGFSIFMITLEIALGVALLVGYRSKLTTRLLLLLTLFFTFLTSYVLFSGKIKACGCFGDCIPLTPVQTFTKDIVLLLLIMLLVIKHKHIQPLLGKMANGGVVLAGIIGALLLQWWVLKHLPLVDCLPYKKGNNIVELRKMPADAVPDKYSYAFIYTNNGVDKEFTDMKNLPDSPWVFKDRKQVLIEKGRNNVPVISDFMLGTAAGGDTTNAILGQPGKYYLLFIKDMETYSVKGDADIAMAKKLYQQKIPFYIVTSQPRKVAERFGRVADNGVPLNLPILTCDAVVLKTAARCNPVLYHMQGGVVQAKWSGVDIPSNNY